MSEIPVTGISGSIAPPWVGLFEDAVEAARADGWNLKAPIVVEGHPYIWEDEPRMARWTLYNNAER